MVFEMKQIIRAFLVLQMVYFLTAYKSAARDGGWTGAASDDNALYARDAGAGPTGEDAGMLWTIRVRVNEITVPFSATDRNKTVEGITAADVRLTDDERPVEHPTYFGHLRELPLRLGILIDSSDSVIQRSDFEAEAASTFLRQVLKPETDKAFIMQFTTKRPVIQEETGDLTKLESAIQSLNPKGRTAMFDAIEAACKKLGSMPSQGRVAKVLVLVSDGGDNSSRTTLAEAIALAQRYEVMIFTIGASGSRAFYQRERRSDGALRKLAEETGGRAYFADTSKQLQKSFSALDLEIRDRYVMSYKATELKDDGRYHKIGLTVSKGGKLLKVLARKGYYAHGPSPE